MKKIKLAGLLMFLTASILSAQPHFMPNWTGYGLDHMNIYVTLATNSGSNLQAGDEIGVFDGDACVGVAVLSQELTGGAVYLEVKASTDDPGTAIKDGFTVGNPVVFKFYDDRIIEPVLATATAGTLVFSSGATLVVELRSEGNPPPEITVIPGQTIDEGSTFTQINLDEYVSDANHADAVLTWSATGNSNLIVSISNRIATILTPNENWNGSETITFTVENPEGQSASIEVYFSVNPINDGPVVNCPQDIVYEEGFVTREIDLSALIFDPDGDAVTISVTSSDPAVAYASESLLTLTISEAGLGTTAITVCGNDGHQQSCCTFNIEVLDVVQPPEDWLAFDFSQFENNGQITAQAILQGVPVESGFLGAFVGDECRGYADAQYFQPADHYVFDFLIYSNASSGETITFRYYDPGTDVVHELETTIEFATNMLLGTAPNPILLIDCTRYTKTLNLGWTWFSLNNIVDDMSLGSLLSCSADGDYIKNREASAHFYQQTGWFGHLEALNTEDMFMIFVNNACEISYCGTVEEVVNTSISLNAGWNTIPYLPEFSMPIEEALASITFSDLDYIKSQTQFARYYEGSGWFGTLETMNPSEGYMIYLANPATLIYPGTTKKAVQIESEKLETESYVNPHGFEFSGSVTASVTIGGDLQGSEKDVLFAYVNEQCRGGVKGMYFEPTQSYIFPLLIYSNIQEGETINFKYFNASNDSYHDVLEELKFEENMIIADAVNSLGLNAIKGLSSIYADVDQNSKLQIYPNPANGVLNLKINGNGNTDCKIAIYTISGQFIDEVYAGDLMTGAAIQWECDHLSAGVYFVVMESKNERLVKRIALMK